MGFLIFVMVAFVNLGLLSQSLPMDQPNEDPGVELVGRKQCNPLPGSCFHLECGGRKKCGNGTYATADEVPCKLHNGAESRQIRCCKCASPDANPEPTDLTGGPNNIQVICNGNHQQCPNQQPSIIGAIGSGILNNNPGQTV